MSRRRIVLTTGSTSGIGAAVAERFAAAGDEVVLHGRSADRAELVASRIRGAAPEAVVRVVLADLADPEECAALIEQAAGPARRIDILVNNAGLNVFTGVTSTTLEDWQHALDVDLRAAWLCSRAAMALMPAGGSIVNVASNHALYTMAGSFPYNVAKAGVVALTQSLAIELGPKGIRANAVLPGWVDTPLAHAYFEGFRDPTAERARVDALHLVGRIARPDEIAAAVEFLASEDAGFVTGTTLLLDGGRSALMEDPRREAG